MLIFSKYRVVRAWKLLPDSNYNCTHCFYGHIARIWDVDYIPEFELLVSCSEDNTARIWDLKSPNGDIKQEIIKYEGHVGKSVWCTKYNPTMKLVATGGADSSIKLWSLPSLQDTEER
jgi:WD40 repeat protein